MMTEEQIDENCYLIGDLNKRMISNDYLKKRHTDWMTGRRQFVWTGKQPKAIGNRPFSYRTQYQLLDDPNRDD